MSDRTCSVDGCSKSRKPRDGAYCSMHRARLSRHGSVHGKAVRKSLDARVMERVPTHIPDDECWPWLGHLNERGYSTLRHAGGVVYGHRAVYEIKVGPIPDGMLLDHICHVPACVNPNHLRPVSPKQNVENFGPTARANNTSGYRGASFHKPSGLWHATATHAGRTHSGGYYKTVAEAGAAARALRLALHSHNDMDRAS